MCQLGACDVLHVCMRCAGVSVVHVSLYQSFVRLSPVSVCTRFKFYVVMCFVCVHVVHVPCVYLLFVGVRVFASVYVMCVECVCVCVCVSLNGLVCCVSVCMHCVMCVLCLYVPIPLTIAGCCH